MNKHSYHFYILSIFIITLDIFSCSTGSNLEVENQLLRMENRELKEEIRVLKESNDMQPKPTMQEDEKNIRKLPPQKPKGNSIPKFSM